MGTLGCLGTRRTPTRIGYGKSLRKVSGAEDSSPLDIVHLPMLEIPNFALAQSCKEDRNASQTATQKQLGLTR
jgi:hypothetical protein